jgi:hypothetical protein
VQPDNGQLRDARCDAFSASQCRVNSRDEKDVGQPGSLAPPLLVKTIIVAPLLLAAFKASTKSPPLPPLFAGRAGAGAAASTPFCC